MGDTEVVAARHLDMADKEQRQFFKKAYGKKDATPDEFDLIVNCDFLTSPEWAAEVVVKAFEEKFK